MIQFISVLDLSAKTLKDQAGRIVNMPDNPVRIVSLAPSITEIVFSLEQEKRLAGVTQFSDFPVQAQKMPKVGSYVHLDLEKIVSLKPDLCIAIKDGNPVEVIARLEKMGIPVYAVNPVNMDSVLTAIKEIGNILNAETQAEVLTQNMISRINHVKTQVAKLRHRPGVFFQIGINPIVAVGRKTFIHELIVNAGGTNLSQGDIPYPRFSHEQVIALSPEILIITSMARGEIFQKVKEQWKRWPEMPAVKNNRIYLVDSNIFDRPTPRMVTGLEQLFGIIHPETGKTKK
ncbi:putative ABC transporter, substrate-binding protein [Desulfonema limicola]|uniref:ABC transporter, substrate-binding protein n=1 Tax=Desulfonema limicola TaxID=45656 RepID=A0A975GIN1_9BACT|nr:cobalamin-binding protein [Desulfonema limicola]QTA82616.1 putative ABC transporter, substrate-binding protein [Desulfonema limicola]